MVLGGKILVAMMLPWLLLVTGWASFLTSVWALKNLVTSHYELQLNQMHWLAGAAMEKPLVSGAEHITLKPFAELGLSNEDTIMKISQTLRCASQDHNALLEGACAGSFKSLVKDWVIVLQDDENKAFFFGYSFFINRPLAEPEEFRNIIYERAKEAWEAILPLTSNHVTYQQYHVGYGSGGSTAHLIAHRVLTSRALPFIRLSLHNELNQIKVITVSATPMLTDDVSNDPIGLVNHANFVTNAREVPGYRFRGTMIKIPNYKVERSRMEVPLERLALFSTSKSALIRLQSMREDARKDFKNAVLTRLETVEMIAMDFAKIFKKKARKLYGQDQIFCAQNIEDVLENYLPHAEDSKISCQVRESEEVSKEEFNIRCVITLKNDDGDGEGGKGSKSFGIASFHGRLTSLNKYGKVCGEIGASQDPREKWSKCLHALVLGNEELSLISPHSKDKNGNCRFIPNLKHPNWSRRPIGCAIKPTAMDDSLYYMYEEEPNLFHSLIPDNAEFPPACTSVIRPIVFRGDSKQKAKELLGDVAYYFEEMAHREYQRSLPTRRTSSLPILFTPHDTNTFRTKNLALGSNLFIADGLVVDNILKCVNSPNAKFVDCTVPANQWIPGACPSFCTTDQQQQVGLCKIMTHCPSVSAFIGISNIYLPQIFANSVADATEALIQSDIAQHVLYTFTKHGHLARLSEVNVGIFFTKLPQIQKRERVTHRATKRIHNEPNSEDEDYW